MARVSTIWTYQLNNVTREFGVQFDYLSRKFVQVTLLGTDRKPLRFLTDYRFLNSGTITTNKAWGPSDGYNYIEIKRVTSATDLIVDFTDGSILRAGDLTDANLQAMHIAEEARDLASDGISINDEGQLDARFRRIVNLNDPVGRKDAVNKAYVDDARESVIESRDKALRYRNEALGFRNQAEGFKNETNTIRNKAIDQTNAIKNQAVEQTTFIKEEAKSYAESSSNSAAVSKAQIALAKDVLEDVRDEGVIANGYAVATIEHAKASAANAQAALTSATYAQNSLVECAGHEAATAKYEERARQVEATVVAAKTTAEQKAKEANVSASKANSSKELAEQAKAEAKAAASQTNLYKDSAAESAAAAARDAASAAQSANNAITQASNALASATNAKTSETKAKEYADSINPDNLFPKTGGILNGHIEIKTGGSYATITLENASNPNQYYFEASSTACYLATKPKSGGVSAKKLTIPNKAGTLAVAEETLPKTGGSVTTSAGSIKIPSSHGYALGIEGSSRAGLYFKYEDGPTEAWIRSSRGSEFFYIEGKAKGKNGVFKFVDEGTNDVAVVSKTLPRFRVRGTNFNFDTATTEGYYQISGATSGTGAPDSIEGYMIVVAYDDGHIEQKVYKWNSGVVYQRSSRNLSEARWTKYEIPKSGSSYSTLDILRDTEEESTDLYSEVRELKAQVAELRELLNASS